VDHEGPQNKIIQIDEALVKRGLSEVVCPPLSSSGAWIVAAWRTFDFSHVS
jgi:hypothetical protein